MMKSNKLIYIFILSALVGYSSQSFAIPVSMDAEGAITNYSFSTASDPFAGAFNIDDPFSSQTILDPGTAVDRDASANVGRYSWGGDVFETVASFGSVAINTQNTYLTILNNYNGIDLYRIDSWGTYNGTRVLFNIILQDNSGTVFDSDAFVLEPSLNGFDNFDDAYFLIRGWDSGTNNLDYMIRGDLVSLIDPPCEQGIPCDEQQVASVPEPGTIFLLGLGLIAVFFASRKGSVN